MKNYLLKLFVLPAIAAKLREEQIADAELMNLHHLAQAEEQFSLAHMYQTRVDRLKKDMPAKVAVLAQVKQP